MLVNNHLILLVVVLEINVILVIVEQCFFDHTILIFFHLSTERAHEAHDGASTHIDRRRLFRFLLFLLLLLLSLSWSGPSGPSTGLSRQIIAPRSIVLAYNGKSINITPFIIDYTFQPIPLLHVQCKAAKTYVEGHPGLRERVLRRVLHVVF